MVKSNRIKKVRLRIPRYEADAALNLRTAIINLVVLDNYNINNPIYILDTNYKINGLVLDTATDKYIVDLELSLDQEDGVIFKYRYGMENTNKPNVSGNLNDYTFTEFSVPTSLYGNQEGLKIEGMLVLTPEIEVKERIGTLSGDLLEISASEFVSPLGLCKHKYTNWKVIEVSDTKNVIYSRKDDDINLNKLTLPLSKFDTTKLYVIECSYLSDTNIESFTARKYYNRSLRVVDSVTIEPILPFTIGQKFYYNLTCNVLNAKYINIIIKEKTGVNETVVDTHLRIPIDSYVAFTPAGLQEGLVYNVYYYLTISENGQEVDSSEEFIHSFTYQDGSFYSDVKTQYPGKYDAMYPIQTGNFRCVSYQLKNGLFLLGKNRPNELSLFMRDGDSVRDTGIKVNLPVESEDGFPDFIALQLSNGRVMINYATYQSNFRRSCWALYDVNLSTNEFNLLDHVIYNDEYLSCGHNGSAIAIGNDVYYVPYKMYLDGFALGGSTANAKLKVSVNAKTVNFETVDVPENQNVVVPIEAELTGFDKTNVKMVIPKLNVLGTPSPLKLFKLSYDGSDFTRTELVAEINPDLKENVSICNKDNDIFIFGGIDAARNYIYPNVYRYSLTDSQLSQYTLLNNTSNYSKKNAVSVFTRPDGKLIMFNNSFDGGDPNDSSTVILDTTRVGNNDFATIENNDMKINVPFVSTVVLRDGGFIRLSYNDNVIKHVMLYPPKPLQSYDDYDATVSSTLIVRRNEVIKVLDIDEISFYSKVIIEGDNLENTGKLILVDEFNTREFDFRTEIITRNTTRTQEEERNTKKEKVFVVPGVNYEVQ